MWEKGEGWGKGNSDILVTFATEVMDTFYSVAIIVFLLLHD